MTIHTTAQQFACDGSLLLSILHRPARALPRGLLVVTGGPQYRIGSHRQFVLLARHLAQAGIAVLRFDLRGMGDSEGAPGSFEHSGPDLRCAVNHFFSLVPELRELVLWGLCDGATAAAFYAGYDRRVTGMVLLNPWVRTEQGAAQALLRHYYWQRLGQRAFWRKLLHGHFSPQAALASWRQLRARARQASTGQQPQLPARLYQALSAFQGQILLVLSGADLTAREFAALADSDCGWRALLASPRIRQVVLAQANHTFSRAAWRAEVATLSADWMASW